MAVGHMAGLEYVLMVAQQVPVDSAIVLGLDTFASPSVITLKEFIQVESVVLKV